MPRRAPPRRARVLALRLPARLDAGALRPVPRRAAARARRAPPGGPVFWPSAFLPAGGRAPYGPCLAAVGRARGGRPQAAPRQAAPPPRVSLIVAAHREEEVIAAKVANALALDWPRDRLEVIV